MAIVRKLYPSAKTFQPYLVNVSGRVAIGATGAVGAQTGKGFTVTRTGAGLYTITLDASNSVPNILYADVNVVSVSGGATYSARILTIAPSSKQITLQTNADAAVNTAADPANGCSLQLFVIVQNSGITG